MGGTGNTFGQQGQATATGAGGGQGSGFIQADASTNSLIITAPDAIYRNLRGVIDQLDVRRAQVYIEALVVEVTANDAVRIRRAVGRPDRQRAPAPTASAACRSSTRRHQQHHQPGHGRGHRRRAAPVPAASPARDADRWAACRSACSSRSTASWAWAPSRSALESTGNANILSTPNMITLDNELATIKVGQNIPIITGSFTTGASGASNPFQTVDRKDVGLLLKVRPQISEGGTIKLAIYHENSGIDNSVAANVERHHHHRPRHRKQCAGRQRPDHRAGRPDLGRRNREPRKGARPGRHSRHRQPVQVPAPAAAPSAT